MNYSLLKGISKSLVAVLAFLAALVITLRPEVANMPLSDFVASIITKYAGSLTVGGLIMLLVNFVKVATAK